MGTFGVQIEVARPYSDEFVSIEALVDTGATYSVFPSDILEKIGATVEENRTFELADGRIVELPLGFVSIRLLGKRIIAPAVFGPDAAAPLLGATALEIFSLAVDPVRQVLVPANALLMSGFNGNFGNGTSGGGVS